MSGVGRGRGWLNIKREPQAPGGIMATTTTTVTEDDPIQKFLGYIDNITEIPSKYSKAFQEFETITNEEILKRKLEEYQYNEEDIYQCILLLVQKYLVQWNMGFQAINNAYKVNRKALLNSAQNVFENREYLFKRNKPAFVKLMIMLARFYALMGMSFTALAVFKCSQYILEPVHNEYVPIFTRCLHQVFNSDVYCHSGKKLLLQISKDKYVKFDEDKFCMHFNLTEAICATNDVKTRYWLCLAIDIWDSRSEILPEDTLAFYAKHLGAAEISYFRQVPDVEQPLYLDTNQSLHSLEQYVSGVSVLKIDDSPSSQERQNDVNNQSASVNVNVANPDRINSATSRASNSHSGDVVPVTATQYVPDCYQQPPPPIIPTTASSGRAILGSGARNHRNSSKQHSPRYEQAAEAMNGWREDQPPPQHHGAGSYSGGGGSRPPPPDLPRNHSAWNHDDRC